MRNIKVLFTIIVFLFITCISYAQENQDPVGSTVDWWDRLSKLLNKDATKLTPAEKDEMLKYTNYLEVEDKRLDTIVYNLTDLDEMSKDFLPQWIVQDEELQIELLNKLILYFGFNPSMINKLKNDFQANKLYIRVVQKPQTEKEIKAALKAKKTPKKPPIIGVFLSKEHRIVGAENIKKILGKDLVDKLSNADDYKVKTGYELLRKQPRFATTALSIFDGNLTLNLLSDTAVIKVGIGYSIGYDYLNLPFWYGSVWNVGAFYQPSDEQYYYIGTLIPFRPGQEKITLVGPLNLNSRKLNGSYGVTGEFNIKLFDKVPVIKNTSLNIGGNFSYSTLNTLGNEILVNGYGTFLSNADADKQDFYYIASNAHGFVEFFKADYGLKVALGLGYFQVYNSIVDDDGETIKKLIRYTRSKLFLRAIYDHQGITNYKIGLQLFHNSLMVTGELKLFSFLSILTKYSRVLGRDLEPWEYKDYFTISPKITFEF
jgi:hypothetical protein